MIHFPSSAAHGQFDSTSLLFSPKYVSLSVHFYLIWCIVPFPSAGVDSESVFLQLTSYRSCEICPWLCHLQAFMSSVQTFRASFSTDCILCWQRISFILVILLFIIAGVFLPTFGNLDSCGNVISRQTSVFMFVYHMICMPADRVLKSRTWAVI